MDTMPGTRGAVPHLTQIQWKFDGYTRRSSSKVQVDGAHYYVGHGDPGRAQDGECNNCLIDSLWQCLGITADRKAVRADLEKQLVVSLAALPKKADG